MADYRILTLKNTHRSFLTPGPRTYLLEILFRGTWTHMARVDSAGGVKQIVDYLRRSKARGNKLSIVRATVEKAPYPLL